MSWMDDLTWTCHVCGDERPDRFISVYKRTTELPSGVVIEENVRYCNDRAECAGAAPTVSFLGREEGGTEVPPS